MKRKERELPFINNTVAAISQTANRLVPLAGGRKTRGGLVVWRGWNQLDGSGGQHRSLRGKPSRRTVGVTHLVPPSLRKTDSC